MAIYEFICHDCSVIWEREAPMSKAPSRSRCPECKKLSNRHWGEVPVVFNGSDYYTNKRKQHNLVYKDKSKAKEIHENLLDGAKRMSEEQQSPYKSIELKKSVLENLVAQGAVRKKTSEEKRKGREHVEKIGRDAYNSNSSLRKLKGK